MLKGFFYRRTPKNNQSPTDVLIRFEINSKESILATVANLNQAGIHFFLPRGKVILVPDERILLILNSPEHGEFKIPCDVYYFCNTTDTSDNQLVNYGVKFYELSDSTWDIIQEFCGNNYPEVTFLNSIPTNKPVERQPHSPLSSAKPAADIKRNPVSPTTISTASFIPFTPLPPLMPVTDVPAIAHSNTATNPSENPKRPMEQREIITSTSGHDQIDFHTEISSKPEPKTESVAVDTGEQAQLNPDLAITTPPSSASVGRDTSGSKPKTKSVSIPTPAGGNLQPAAKEEPPTKLHQSPIQVLAASLATPPLPHTQPKAQSLSQEMIDRLIEKLQVEDDETTESQASVLPSASIQKPDHLKVSPSELNTTYQTLLHSGQSGNPQNTIPPSNPEQPTMAGLTTDSKIDNHLQPGAPEEIATTAANPFDPFTALNFKSNNTLHSELNKTKPVSSETTDSMKTVPLNPFAFQTTQDTPSEPPRIESKQSVSDPEPHTAFFHNTPSFPSHDGLTETSLDDLVSNLDSTINKNAVSENTKPLTAAKPKENTGSHISLGEFKKSVAPMVKTLAHGSTIIPNTSGISLDQKAIDKLVDSLIKDMTADDSLPDEPLQQSKPDSSSGNSPTVKNWTESALKAPVQKNPPATNSAAKGLNIIDIDPNKNRVMDQKSIDMIVKTLTEADPIGPSQQPEEPPLTNAIPLKPFQAKEPKRILDQKAIDQVVQALTQNYSTKNNHTAINNGNTAPFNNIKPMQPTRPTEVPTKERTGACSLASLKASLQLENGKIIHAAVEEIYVGGLMVAIEQELPLNSAIKLNLLSDYIHINGVLGTCTNCEATPSGKTGFLAEIFFKNMNNTHMEQFRALIGKLDLHHQD
jgi:hypothetical protein